MASISKLTLVKRLAFLLVAAMPLYNTAAQADTEHTSTMLVEMRGSINHMKEQCVDFESGDNVAFEFSSKHPLDFNVHYHLENSTEFPVKQSAIKAYRGKFIVGDVEQYCFMWTNKQRVNERWEFTMKYTRDEK